MTHAGHYHSPAEAARLLGVSSKALRLYEERGFIRPIRDGSGWRQYGPTQIVARAQEVIALRALGLSLRQIGAVLSGTKEAVEAALANQESQLQAKIRNVSHAVEQVRAWQGDLRKGRMPDLTANRNPAVSLILPWPWAGGTFTLRHLAPVCYLVGSLGSGKTRLAKALAEALNCPFVALDRGRPTTLGTDAQCALDWLLEDGATDSSELRALLGAMLAQQAVVVDLIEHGLDEPTQLALGAWLRQRGDGDAPLVVMTRSSAVLDLDAVADGHAILYCPANHSPPFEVLPLAGTRGYEGVANCLGTPEARARLLLGRPD